MACPWFRSDVVLCRLTEPIHGVANVDDDHLAPPLADTSPKFLIGHLVVLVAEVDVPNASRAVHKVPYRERPTKLREIGKG